MFLVVSFLGLAACGGSGGGTTAKADDTTTVDIPTPPPATPPAPPVETPVVPEFPEEALAIRPEPTKERRDTGNTGDDETYYVSVVAEEEIGCMKRRVEIKGSFFKNDSENWSSGQTSEWNSERSEVYVQIRDDSFECGGSILIFENTVYMDDITSFTVNGQSIAFSAEVPVYDWNTGETYSVTISIDSSEAATGELTGGNITTSKNVEWGNEYDSSSTFRGEGVNIILDGGVYIDNLPVIGNLWAKVSKYVNKYKTNGARPVDPFYCCTDDGKG